MRQLSLLIIVSAAGMPLAGCSKEEPSSTTLVKPREAPTLTPSAAPITPPTLDGANTGESMTALPPGHPPINRSASAPSGEMNASARQDAAPGLQLQMPPEFKPQQLKPSPFQPLHTYSAPKAEGDTEDAYVSISALGKGTTFQQNLDRWCGQFGLSPGKDCENGVKQQKLEGITYPTTVIEVAGTYKGSSMMGPWPSAMPSFEMVVAEIELPDKMYYVKIIGPQKTVERWKAQFVDAIKTAK